MIEQFFIVNKSGGMIYKYEHSRQTEINSLLILTSTLHSLNELSRNVLKTAAYSQTVEMQEMVIHIFRTLTNTMFIFVSKRTGRDDAIHRVFEDVYRHFCDYVLSNPFYQDSMPINCVKFRPDQFFV